MLTAEYNRSRKNVHRDMGAVLGVANDPNTLPPGCRGRYFIFIISTEDKGVFVSISQIIRLCGGLVNVFAVDFDELKPYKQTNEDLHSTMSRVSDGLERERIVKPGPNDLIRHRVGRGEGLANQSHKNDKMGREGHIGESKGQGFRFLSSAEQGFIARAARQVLSSGAAKLHRPRPDRELPLRSLHGSGFKLTQKRPLDLYQLGSAHNASEAFRRQLSDRMAWEEIFGE